MAGAAELSAAGGPGDERVVLPSRELFWCVQPAHPTRPLRLLRCFSLKLATRSHIRAHRSLSGHRGRIPCLCPHPFLPLLVSGSDHPDCTVRVWDLASQSLLGTLEGHRDVVLSLAFDPAGRTLASSSGDRTVRLWDLESGSLRHSFRDAVGYVYAVAWDPTGSYVAAGSDDAVIRIWDAVSGVLRHVMAVHEDSVFAIASHPTDALFASGSADFTVRVWSWSSGSEVHTLRGHTGPVTSLAASKSYLASGSEDATVRLWSWSSEACERVLDGFSQPLGLNSLSWRDATLVVSEKEGPAWVWDASAAHPGRWVRLGALEVPVPGCDSTALLGDGRIAYSEMGSLWSIGVWG